MLSLRPQSSMRRLGERLSLSRAARRWSAGELARAAGVSVGVVRAIEAGDVPDDLANLVKIAGALRVRVKWLVFGDGEAR